jgi:hypothetical protein
MKYYTLINPSDGYTLKAEEDKIAIVAAALVGNGAYALDDELGNDVLPIFFRGGVDEYIANRFGETTSRIINDNLLAVADCLESFAICGIKQRKLYDAALDLMSEEARAQWRELWHDRNRTSLNNIGSRAWAYAQKARDRARQAV